MRRSYTPPAWAASLTTAPQERLQMVHGPTPLQPWSPPGLPDDISCWIKRDDLTGMALSGNKIRKLEFLLADAQAQGCDIVITCGGVQSNHCRATAVAARMLGLDSCLLLRTGDPSQPPPSIGNVLLDQLVGAQIIPINREQYTRRHELMEDLASSMRAEGRRPYLIPEGGSNGLGTWGYVEAINELQTQLDAQGLEIDDLIFACGSGGTAAGLALGATLAKTSYQVRGINVCDDDEYFYNIIDTIYGEMGYTGHARDTIDIIDGYKGLGYAQSSPEELAYIQSIAGETGILLDPVYSGKAMYGLSQELRKNPGRFRGKRLLFIHTGGLFGLMAKADMLTQHLPAQRWSTWAKGR